MIDSSCYLLHGLLIDVLLEDVGLSLDGVPLQCLQDFLWCDEAIFGLQQGQIEFLCLKHCDHFISGLKKGKKVDLD